MLIIARDFESHRETAVQVSISTAIRLAMAVTAGCRWSSAEKRDQSSSTNSSSWPFSSSTNSCSRGGCYKSFVSAFLLLELKKGQ